MQTPKCRVVLSSRLKSSIVPESFHSTVLFNPIARLVFLRYFSSKIGSLIFIHVVTKSFYASLNNRGDRSTKRFYFIHHVHSFQRTDLVEQRTLCNTQNVREVMVLIYSKNIKTRTVGPAIFVVI